MSEGRSVSETVAARRSVRAFLDRPVPRATIEDILTRASRAPSGGNLQPWAVHVVTGAALAALKERMKPAIAASPAGEGSDFDIYPPDLGEPWAGRRRAVGQQLYALLGIAREDRLGRMLQFARNYDFFGAPAGLFFSIDRQMGYPQFAHLGMFIQTVILLAEERGLSTCPQEAWAAFPKTVGAFLDLPETSRLYCGMALGHADPEAPENALRTERAALGEFATFLDAPPPPKNTPEQ